MNQFSCSVWFCIPSSIDDLLIFTSISDIIKFFFFQINFFVLLFHHNLFCNIDNHLDYVSGNKSFGMIKNVPIGYFYFVELILSLSDSNIIFFAGMGFNESPTNQKVAGSF